MNSHVDIEDIAVWEDPEDEESNCLEKVIISFVTLIDWDEVGFSVTPPVIPR